MAQRNAAVPDGNKAQATGHRGRSDACGPQHRTQVPAWIPECSRVNTQNKKDRSPLTESSFDRPCLPVPSAQSCNRRGAATPTHFQLPRPLALCGFPDTGPINEHALGGAGGSSLLPGDSHQPCSLSWANV